MCINRPTAGPNIAQHMGLKHCVVLNADAAQCELLTRLHCIWSFGTLQQLRKHWQPAAWRLRARQLVHKVVSGCKVCGR
jgi:hypothetical protein